MLLEAAASATGFDNIVGLLREFGFPTFFCIWLMWRLEKRLDSFLEIINRLFQIVVVMAKTIDATSPEKTLSAIEKGNAMLETLSKAIALLPAASEKSVKGERTG